MPQESMTSKERWLAVLQRETPDRVPMDYWGTEETMAILMQHLGCSDRGMSSASCTSTIAVQPAYVGPPSPTTTICMAAAFAM